MERIKECLVDLFTVYYPHEQGIPRKYLVREKSVSIFDHNSLREIHKIPLQEKEAIWFAMHNMLGEDFIKRKLNADSPIKRKTVSVLEEYPRRKYFTLAQLEKGGSPQPQRPKKLPAPDSQSFYMIEEETKEINRDFAKEMIRSFSAYSNSKSAIQGGIQKLTIQFPDKSWQIKTMSVGLLFGSPRLVFTDLQKIFVISGTNRIGTTQKRSLNSIHTFQMSVLSCLAHIDTFVRALNSQYVFSRNLREILDKIRTGNPESAYELLISIISYFNKANTAKEFLDALLKYLDKNMMALFCGSGLEANEYQCGVRLEKPEELGFLNANDSPQNAIDSLEVKNLKVICPTHNKLENCRKVFQLKSVPRILVIEYKNYEIDLNRDSYVELEGLQYKLVALIFNKSFALCKFNNEWYLYESSVPDSYANHQIANVNLVFYEKIS